MDKDELVLIILGRPFLATERAVIDVHEGKLSLRVGSETITFNIGNSMKSKHSRGDYLYCADHTATLIQEQWVNTDRAGGTTRIEIPGESTKTIKHGTTQTRIEGITGTPLVVPKKGGMTVVKNEKGNLILQRTVTGWRMLERLAGHEYYCFLDGFFGYIQIPISPENQEKTTFTCPYRTFAYKRMPFGLCNPPATFQRCMTATFHELIKDSMEVFMEDFSVFGSSFDHCLKNLEKMLKRCEETNLVLDWEKCHFMVKEGIILGHKVSSSGIGVDKARIEAISKLPYLTNVKAIQSFLGHAGFYRRFIKDFSQIARPMTQLLVKDSPFKFFEECIKAFDILKHELTQAPIMIKPDWSLPFENMCDTSDYAVG
ncbi:reverse transcriptase domain-containing protein [Tanacetum coccineum]